MPRTALTPKSPPGKYPGSIAAEAADYTYDAADPVDGNEIPLSGYDLLLVRNVGAGAQTITISSVKDPHNRVGDIGPYSVGIGEFAIFGPFLIEGWANNPGQKLFIDVDSADIEVALIKLPR